ncbi:MAG: amidohydrolase family protein [Hyphomicrobiaceae bacterium]
MPLDAPPAADATGTATPSNRLAVIDSDIHPAVKSLACLKPYVEKKWWDHAQTYGFRRRHGSPSVEPYPKSAPLASRRDAWPEDGIGRPGSSLELMQKQYLDPAGVEVGVLGPLGNTGQGELNLDFGAAFCRATNEWQRDAWTSKDKRLKAAIVVPYEDGLASAKEIERVGHMKDYAQVFCLTRSSDPLGNRRYWPIYAAAQDHDLPVAFHVFGTSGHPVTGAGWPSYYIEEGSGGHSTSAQTVVTSLVMEGVFERFPKLKVVIVEGGFGWLPPLSWRLDKIFEKNRDELSHLTRRPSDYIKQHIWVSTQPMAEPEDRHHLLDTLRWVGHDRLLFASDYPHWDFDDPFRAFPAGVTPAEHRAICAENGLAVYRL